MFTKEATLGITDKHIHYIDNHIGVHHQMLDAWKALQQSALDDGITLAIVSGFRNFDRQLRIWNKKCLGQITVLDKYEKPIDITSLNDVDKIKSIMLFSALPGASRHHWGTDIDVYAPNMLAPDYQLKLQVCEYEKNGPLCELNKWLAENIEQFGFYRPYDKYRQGVFLEPWHLSYQPLASQFEKILTVDLLTEQLKTAEIEVRESILTNIEQLFSQFVTNIKGYPHG